MFGLQRVHEYTAPHKLIHLIYFYFETGSPSDAQASNRPTAILLLCLLGAWVRAMHAPCGSLPNFI